MRNYIKSNHYNYISHTKQYKTIKNVYRSIPIKKSNFSCLLALRHTKKKKQHAFIKSMN